MAAVQCRSSCCCKVFRTPRVWYPCRLSSCYAIVLLSSLHPIWANTRNQQPCGPQGNQGEVHAQPPASSWQHEASQQSCKSVRTIQLIRQTGIQVCYSYKHSSQWPASTLESHSLLHLSHVQQAVTNSLEAAWLATHLTSGFPMLNVVL